MGTPYESREYDRLKERGYRNYSRGHRQMYLEAIARIKADDLPVDIFEAGFGIGWGLGQMLESGLVRSYFGVEPNLDSYTFTCKDILARFPQAAQSVQLTHQPFTLTVAADLLNFGNAPYDEAFCIEVIEHVPMEDQLAFLQNLHKMAPRLWFSTPCIRRQPKEGVRTTEEWVHHLELAGWKVCNVNRQNWTYLYECVI